MKVEREQRNMQRDEKITRFGFLWGRKRKEEVLFIFFFLKKKLMKDKVSPRKQVKYLNT